MKEVIIVAYFDGKTIKQIGEAKSGWGLAAYEMKKSVAAYNGFETPEEMPDLRQCDLEGEWKQDGRVWKLLSLEICEE